MKKRSFLGFFKNKYSIAIIVIAIIAAAYYLTHRSSAPTFESSIVTVGNVIEKVSVTGAISPVEKADLAFQKNGVITVVAFKVGDAVKKGDLIASIDSAGDQASLASAQATLSDMSRSLTPEELAVQKTSLDNAKKDALNAIHDGYAKAQGAVINYADTLFSNPQSANPSLNFKTDSPSIQTAINSERALVSDILRAWSLEIASADSATVSSSIVSVQSRLTAIKSFMNDLSAIVGRLSPGNSGLSQAQIDADTAAMNSGLSALNAAIDTVSTAQTGLSLAQSNYDLRLSGNSSQSIAAQAAKVAQAKAVLENDRIVSPINGIVTKADPHVGEFAAAGQSGFAVQSDGGYKIEAYVPESDIAKVALSDHAAVTLDAYGSYVIFPASVSSIDPAETVLEGVPTYKVTLMFDGPDARIRSGMTANTDIMTHERDNVLTVPTRAVVDDNGAKSVRLVSANGSSYVSVPVSIGLKGSDGTIEIVSGVSAGDKVVTYVK